MLVRVLRLSLLESPLYYHQLNQYSTDKVYDKGPQKNYNRKVQKAAKRVEINVNLLENLVQAEKIEEDIKNALQSEQKTQDETFQNILSKMDVHVRSRDEIRRRMGMPEKPTVDSAKPPKRVRSTVSTSFTEGKRLGIFKKPDPGTELMPPDPWTFAEDNEARRIEFINKTKPTNNMFEKLIKESHKLWNYPIDNEEGMSENEVGFEEHVFMTQLLNDKRLPKKGPVRHFMELVATGLSKNPYYSSTEKREHIEWYMKYFSKFPMEELELKLPAELMSEK